MCVRFQDLSLVHSPKAFKIEMQYGKLSLDLINIYRAPITCKYHATRCLCNVSVDLTLDLKLCFADNDISSRIVVYFMVIVC